jgi:hypothetical protein
MTRALSIATAVALALAFSPAAAARQIIGGEQDHSLAAAGDCENFFATTFTNFGAHAQDQEQREMSLDGIEEIRVTAAQQGGLSIRGWNRSGARLVICRNAVANTMTHAARLLESIDVTSHEGRISAAGPQIDQTQAWWVNMILYLPRRAHVDIRAANGGVAIRNMGGEVTAHTTSGGVSVAQSSGRYRITTETGGITLDRISGLVDAVSRDGSIALKIAGAELPSVEARTAEAGHIVCTLKSCADSGSSPAGGGSVFRMGEGVPDIRLATRTASIFIGPVTY